MTSRRLAVAAAVTALTVVAPARATTCPMLVDPVDDGGRSALVGAQLASKHYDVVSADIATGPTTAVTVLRVQSLEPALDNDVAGRWWVEWRVGLRSFRVVAVRDTLPGVSYRGWAEVGSRPRDLGALGFPEWFPYETVRAPATLSVDVAAGTFTWVVARSDVPALATPGFTVDRIFADVRPRSGGNPDNGVADIAYVDQAPACIAAS